MLSYFLLKNWLWKIYKKIIIIKKGSLWKKSTIKNIQQELEDIKNELKDTNLYLENYERYQEITSKMEVLNSDLNTKENRWYELIKMEEDLVSSWVTINMRWYYQI